MKEHRTEMQQSVTAEDSSPATPVPQPGASPPPETADTGKTEELAAEIPFQIHGDAVDVVAIMRQIRERIKQKKEQGIYTDEEIEELSELRIQTYAEASEIDSELLRRLLEPNHAWNIHSGYRITTHRPGWKGKLIVLAKRIVRPIIRLYTDHIVDRQAQLNLYLVYLVHNLVRELTRLQIEHRKVDYRCQVLQREVDFLKERQRAFEELAVLREEPQPAEPLGGSQ